MVWDARLGGNCPQDQELEVAAAIAKVASDLECGVSFWSSNTPIDIVSLMDEDSTPETPQTTAAQVPTKKPSQKKSPATHRAVKK